MADPAAQRRLFAYGTLELPEVIGALLGRALRRRVAVLPGYARRLLRDHPFPGIVAAPEATVTGALYDGVHAADLALLDRFEGSFYERREVRVRVGEDALLSAEAYVIGDARRGMLSDDPWDTAAFRARHLDEYVAHCAALARGWRERS